MYFAGRPLRSESAGWWRAVAAAGAAAAAVVVLLTELLPGTLDSVPGLPDEGSALALGHVLTESAGAALLPLAWSLWRGKRRALRILVGALLAWAALGIAGGATALETGATLAAAVLLLASQRAFSRGCAEPPRLAACAGVLGAAAAAYVLAAAVLLEGDRVRGIPAALAEAGSWLANGSWWLRSGSAVAVALDLLLVLGLGAAGFLLRSLLRSAQSVVGHTVADHARARAIVRAHAADSLDPFALREDKSFHFAHGGLLAYRTLRETAVVAGDPIGPPGSAPAILASFEQLATERGWEVVVTGASERHVADYRASGHRAVRIGEEAIVHPHEFSLEGRAIRKVRQSVARVRRHGWTIQAVEGRDLSAAATAELETVNRAWRARQPRLYGFAMTLGRLWGAEEDEDCIYVLARDADATLRGFLRFLRYDGGLSLDVMRRGGSEPNGLNEAMVVAAIEHARAAGVRELSLNFAGFAHLMAPRVPLTLLQRLLRWALRRAHGRFQLERLVSFNDKFLPEWRPRYMVHCGGPALPLGALRVLQAEAYLRPPRGRPLNSRWQPLGSPVGARTG
jgi:lysyl-tRNA synthetase class 2